MTAVKFENLINLVLFPFLTESDLYWQRVSPCLPQSQSSF